jgi:hypothetical protein
MIRYRWKATPLLIDAAKYCLAGSAALKGRGPWTWSQQGGYTTAELQWVHEDEAPTWSPWRRGLGDYEVSHITPVPEYDPEIWENAGHDLPMVELSSGIKVPVRPLSHEGFSIDWDGSTGLPVTPYGKACVALLSRRAAGEEIAVNDEALLALVRWSLSYGLRMTKELMHIYGLISDGDIDRIMEMIADGPKA